MKVTAFVPIKLSNQRLPGKNLLPLGGKPLCTHIFESLLKVTEINEVYAYCSDESLIPYLPEGVNFLQRDTGLDGDLVKGADIYRAFINEVNSDVYVLAHATSPFVQPSSISKGVTSITLNGYDSSFSAERIQTFAWYNGEPLNYDLTNVPRTQDIDPILIETSGFYIFKREIFTNFGRRIGFNPYIVEVMGLEAIDIDEKKDYEFAKKIVGE